MATAYFVSERPAVSAHRKPAAWSFSLRALFVLVTLIAIALHVGYLVGYQRGWDAGYQEGPFRLRPGSPDNWSPPKTTDELLAPKDK